MDIIDRFQKSLTQYNKAKSLLDKGNRDEAEALLTEALTMYPREILMGGGPDIINEELLNSYETLFTDIKVQLEVIKELRADSEDEDIPVPVVIDDAEVVQPGSITSSSTYVSLQDIVMRNMNTGTVPSRPPVDTVMPDSREPETDLEILTPSPIKEADYPEPDAPALGRYDNDENALNPDDLVAELKMHEETDPESESTTGSEYETDADSHEDADHLDTEEQKEPDLKEPDTEDSTIHEDAINSEHDELKAPETSLDNEFSSYESGSSVEENKNDEPQEIESTEEIAQENRMGDNKMDNDQKQPDGEEIDYEALAKAAEDNGVEEVLDEDEDALPVPKPMSTPSPQQKAANDEEALLSEDEVREDMGLEDKKTKKKKKEKKERKPIVLPDMSKFINAALLLIGLAAVAGSIYFCTTEFNKITIPERAITSATTAFENGNIGEVSAALNELKLSTGWNAEAGSFAIASMVAGWGQTLINEKKIPQATQLLSGAFSGGTKSQAVTESLLDLIISGSEAAGAGAPDKIQKDLNLATRILTAGGLNPVESSTFQKRMGAIAFQTFAATVGNSISSGDGTGAYNGLTNLKSFDNVLSLESRNEAAALKSKTAATLEKNAAAALTKKNFADASRLAGMALELAPSLKGAKRTKTIADGKL